MTTPTITEQIASLTDRIEALEARATVETTGLATAESVTDLTVRVGSLESVVGKPITVDPAA